MSLYIIMYHYVRDLARSAYPEIKGLDLELFEEQLDFLQREFTVVRMEEVLAAVDACRADSGAGAGADSDADASAEKTARELLSDRAVLLTFDDGYADHYDNVFPALQRRGMQGTFFIPGKTFTEHALLDVNKIHFILAASGTARLKEDLLAELGRLRGEGVALPSDEELYAQYGQARTFNDADTMFCKSLLQSALPEAVRKDVAGRLFAKYIGRDETDFSQELYMSKAQMLEMKDAGMFFGLHGYDHNWMNTLSAEELKEDMEKALRATAGLVEENQRVINYPYGRVSAGVVDYMREIGCKAGVTIERGVVEFPGRDAGKRDGKTCFSVNALPTEYPGERATQDAAYLLPRFDCNDFPPKSETYREYA